jgi:hypothetical protein
MPALHYLLAVQHGNTFRKLSKIVLYKNAIGFAVVLPYHQSRKGLLAKHPVKYDRRVYTFSAGSFVEQYVVSDTVKLSVHFNGLVQFSSAGKTPIISGIDRTTGLPKGLGLQARPLIHPRLTGPTFGGTVWGLDDFDILAPRDLIASPTLVWNETDYYYRRCTPKDWNSYVFALREVVRLEDWAKQRAAPSLYRG